MRCWKGADWSQPELPPIFERRRDESFEKGVRSGRFALELGVKLDRDEKRMRGDLDDLAEAAIGEVPTSLRPFSS